MVDHIGAIRAIVAAQVHGAKRFLMRSALNVDVNSKSKMAHYHRAKAHADNHLRETDLDYTIYLSRRPVSIRTTLFAHVSVYSMVIRH